MPSFTSLSLVTYGTLQLSVANTPNVLEQGNVIRVLVPGTITGIEYRSGGQAADPSSLVFNIYRGTTLIHTVTGTSMAGANTIHLVPVTPNIVTAAGEQYTVTVKIPTGGVIYYMNPPLAPYDDQAGLIYVQGRGQTVYQYGYPNEAQGTLKDVNLVHSVAAEGAGGFTPTTPFTSLATSITALNASITSLNDCCAAVLAAVRKTFT